MTRTSSPFRLLAVGASVTGLLALSACSGAQELDAEQRRAKDVSLIFLTSVIEEDASAACAVTATEGVPVHEEPEWEKACVQGVEESNTSQERRKAYERQLDAGASVGEVKDEQVSVTWDKDGSSGVDPTVHTLQKIDQTWYVTQ